MFDGVIIDVSALIIEWGVSLEDGDYTPSEIHEMLVEDIAEKGLHTAEEQKELLRDLLYGLSYDLPDEQQPNDALDLASDLTDLALELKIKALQQERDNLKRDLESVRGILRNIAVNTENPSRLAHQWEWTLAIIHDYAETGLNIIDQKDES